MLFALQDVSLDRGGNRVLDGLDLEIREGASCLVGPSGSGKSTILRLLNRLVDPGAGTVLYAGTDIRERDPRALRREVCLVPQLPALIDGSVADNIRFAASFGQIEPDIRRVLRLGGLDAGFADRDASRISVGEQQRVMLARALALEPKVLLLDEPTSALDEDARDAVEGALAELHGESQISTVVVTHDPAQARRLGEWIVRIDDGKAIGQGPASEVLSP